MNKVEATGSDQAENPAAPALFPSSPGTYVLVLYVASERSIEYGRGRAATFGEGYYLYVGSALKGLKGRLSRHFTHPARLHWHIDRLLCHARLVEVWYRKDREHRECAWAKRLLVAEALRPTPFAFGASDCRCHTHLFHSPAKPDSVILAVKDIQVARCDMDPWLRMAAH
jgi:Uri superfamily endonuclease